jgi:hypothetical protein
VVVTVKKALYKPLSGTSSSGAMCATTFLPPRNVDFSGDA